MPAIQPARLRIQVAELTQDFDKPEIFVRRLDDLFDFYADRTYRPGSSGESRPSLLRSYNVPPPVIRQVHQSLSPLAKSNPEEMLMVCQAIWQIPILEHRLLAAYLFGDLPPDPYDPLLDCLRSWLENKPQEELLDTLLQHGTHALRKKHPEQLLLFTDSWLDRSQILSLQTGLRLLETMVSDDHFEDLPAIFNRIISLVRVLPHPVRPDMVALLTVLIQRSAAETAYFLRENLNAPNNPDTPWLIRQVLGQFPGEMQNKLRGALDEHKKLVP